jgi:hypothetical protein
MDLACESGLTRIFLLANAIRDYDFMIDKVKQCIENNMDDPFQISTQHTLEAFLMEEAGMFPHRTPPGFPPRPDPAGDGEAYERRENILPGVSRSEYRQKADLTRLLERLGMGMAGGVALIVPMLVMVLREDLLTQLLTTTVATMLFAGGLAIFGKNLKGETVLASVAAYAAVLVVFIGTGME